MAFWILVAALAAGVTLVITRPLMRASHTETDARSADIAVYKDQLREVEGEAARGVLAPAEAANARIEISRRLLRAAEQATANPEAHSGSRARLTKAVYVVTSVAIPLASLALYMTFGAPGLPGQPLEERLNAAIDATRPNDLVAKVEARLRDKPDDGAGWDAIAPVYYAMGRFADAATAYRNALRMVGESVKRLQGFADARIRVENGIVPEDAKAALQRIVVLEPQHKEASIWLAMAKEQDGRLGDAIADYKKLIADAPPDAPWRKMLEERVASLERAEASPAAPKAPDGANQPRSDAAVAEMSPSDRQAFIVRMVDGLAARLKADGSDAAGWLKLIKAYDVLGRRGDAIKALNDARAGLKENQTGLAKVEDLARQLGLGSS